MLTGGDAKQSIESQLPRSELQWPCAATMLPCAPAGIATVDSNSVAQLPSQGNAASQQHTPLARMHSDPMPEAHGHSAPVGAIHSPTKVAARRGKHKPARNLAAADFRQLGSKASALAMLHSKASTSATKRLPELAKLRECDTDKLAGACKSPRTHHEDK